MPIFCIDKGISLRFYVNKYLYDKETSANVLIVLMCAQIFLPWRPWV